MVDQIIDGGLTKGQVRTGRRLDFRQADRLEDTAIACCLMPIAYLLNAPLFSNSTK
jgi:hypothetical protein